MSDKIAQHLKRAGYTDEDIEFLRDGRRLMSSTNVMAACIVAGAIDDLVEEVHRLKSVVQAK